MMNLLRVDLYFREGMVYYCFYYEQKSKNGKQVAESC